MSTSLLLKLSCGANLSRRVRSEQGLTLVEIIVVLIILSIIIAFVGTRILGAGDKAKADLTKLKMKDVRSSIEQYQLRYNAVPSNLQSLIECNEETGPGCIPVTNKDTLSDAWGRAFQFQRDGDGRSYRIRSLGADGRDGGDGINFDITETGP